MIDNVPQATKTNYRPVCVALPEAPKVPALAKRGKCPKECDCPGLPRGEPQTCLDNLIRDQNMIIKKAERAKAFADELTEIQNQVKSAQLDYTQARFADLRKTWKEQDGAIVELIRKLVCAVDCWHCLLECRLCEQLGEIRRLEELIDGPPGAGNGTGPLAREAYSLLDQQAWHMRNVAQMEARLKRITDVMAVWQKPSDTIGEVLEKNGNLIKESQQLIASDSAKVIYDVFMTLIPRHWAVRPRGSDHAKEWQTGIADQYVKICGCTARTQQNPAADGKQDGCDDRAGGGDGKPKCACDDGIPDVCCGPDVGILSLRERLIGPLPYLVDPADFAAVICCLTSHRLSPASDQLAVAQANLAATTAEIELVKKQIEDQKAGIEASFREALPNPLDCGAYKKEGSPPPAPRPAPPSSDTKQAA